jgi:CAAX protease family protein
MRLSVFKSSDRQLRNGWWVAIFFLVLAAITFPMILLSQYYKIGITIIYQVVIVIVAPVICQLWRREQLNHLFGVHLTLGD